MEIILCGYLKELHPHPIQVEAGTVAEAVTFLQTLPAFSPLSGKKHAVIIDGFDSRDALYDADRKPASITLRPVVAGAGGSNGVSWAQIVIGAILITVAIAAPFGMTAAMSFSVGLSGSMMILGGVLQLIAPQPKLDAGSEEKSRYLGQGKNTVAIGTRIPMIFGRRKWGGHYISFNINAGSLNAAPASWYSSPFTDYGDTTYSAAPPEVAYPPIDEYDGQPESNFVSVVGSGAIGVDKTYIRFSPAVSLSKGEWDINFMTGQTLHVMVDADGVVGQAELLGGNVLKMPPSGTGIIFTQNYG